MVRRVIHNKRILYGLAVATLAVAALSTISTPTHAANSGNVNFNVNVQEVLSVSLSKPTSWASGNVNNLLRNKLNLSVTSNNSNGFVAYMYADNTRNATANCTNSNAAATALINCNKTSSTIATLASNTTAGSFTTNRWGYSVNDTVEVNNNATYRPLVDSTAPATVLAPTSGNYTTNSGATYARDIYFGAKADTSVDAGTYAGTVVFTVVSGVDTYDTSNPNIPPSDPAVDTDTTTNVATYDSTANRTVYRSSVSYSGSGNSSVSGNTATSTTQVSHGNTVSSYANAQGVTTTTASTANIGEGAPLATGLAVVAGVAAASGVVFFIASKRKKDDDEEDEQY